MCLAIAGSDSGGGAGIQADLKAFAAAGVHGTTAITAITAQNTVAVTAVEPVSPRMIVAQVRAVVEDLGVDAVKIGMVGAAPAIEAVAEALELLPDATPVVVDPVMVAESGARLLAPEAQAALIERLVARAMVATPNLPEARALVGDEEEELSAGELARTVQALGPGVVVVTGGHGEQGSDLFFDGARLVEIPGERHPDGAAHGSGCTHSSHAGRRPCARPRSAGGRADRTPDCRPGRPRRPTRARVGGRAGGRPGPPGPRPLTARDGTTRRSGGAARPLLGNLARGVPTCRVHPRPFAIIAQTVRLLRMKPGHGEVLLAEGDVDVREDEERLVEEFRRQLDAGMWAAVPLRSAAGRREAVMVKAFDDVPRDADRVIFFPRAAGGV